MEVLDPNEGLDGEDHEIEDDGSEDVPHDEGGVMDEEDRREGGEQFRKAGHSRQKHPSDESPGDFGLLIQHVDDVAEREREIDHQGEVKDV